MTDPYLDDLEFANNANIEAARKFKAERDALREVLLRAKAFIVIDSLSPAEHTFEIKKRAAFRKQLVEQIDALTSPAPHPIEKIEGGAK